MRKLLFIPLLIGIALSFSSCNIGDARNYVNSNPAPAVIGYKSEMGGTVLCTPWGYYAAPSLFMEYFEGDCVITQFSIDYDNQPTDKYTTATDILTKPVSWTDLYRTDHLDLDGHSLTISAAAAITCEFYNGKFFILANTKDKSPHYRLIYNPNEQEVDGVKNLYLQARQSDTSSTSESSTYYAFELFDFINSNPSCRDTTINYLDGPANLRYIRANLHYVSNISTEGVPTYSKAAGPFEIFIF